MIKKNICANEASPKRLIDIFKSQLKVHAGTQEKSQQYLVAHSCIALVKT